MPFGNGSAILAENLPVSICVNLRLIAFDALRSAPKIHGWAGAPSTGPPLDYWYELVDQRVAAAFLGVKPKTIADWRYREVGPNWVDISPTCKRYRRIDLQAYIEQKTQTAINA